MKLFELLKAVLFDFLELLELFSEMLLDFLELLSEMLVEDFELLLLALGFGSIELLLDLSRMFTFITLSPKARDRSLGCKPTTFKINVCISMYISTIRRGATDALKDRISWLDSEL